MYVCVCVCYKKKHQFVCHGIVLVNSIENDIKYRTWTNQTENQDICQNNNDNENENKSTYKDDSMILGGVSMSYENMTQSYNDQTLGNEKNKYSLLEDDDTHSRKNQCLFQFISPVRSDLP